MFHCDPGLELETFNAAENFHRLLSRSTKPRVRFFRVCDAPKKMIWVGSRTSRLLLVYSTPSQSTKADDLVLELRHHNAASVKPIILAEFHVTRAMEINKELLVYHF